MSSKLNFNSILKNHFEVDESINKLNILGLSGHPDTMKSWDMWKILSFIKSKGDGKSKILDVGCNGSPVLPSLEKIGFKTLYGCDVDLNLRKRRLLRRIKNKISREDPDYLIKEMLTNKEKKYNLTVQDLEKTNYESEFFDFITSLSVIEHGVNLKKYFEEMKRILKKDGFLLTSTDYWPEKIETVSNVYNRSSNDIIFDQSEIKEMINLAKKIGFSLIEDINFQYDEKVVEWKKTGKKYTFIFFILKKD